MDTSCGLLFGKPRHICSFLKEPCRFRLKLGTVPVSTAMAPKRSGAARKFRAAAAEPKTKSKLVKALDKKTQSEQKNQAKKESKVSGHFQKAMNTFFERTIQEDRQFVLKMISENDPWIPRLAALFRSGAMKQLLETGTLLPELGSDGGEQGPSWKGKVYKILGLPLEAKLCMVKPFVKLNMDDEQDAGGPWLDLVMKFLFHVDERTPLPRHPDIRKYHVLAAFAKCRVEHLGGNRLEGVSVEFGKKENLKFFHLDEACGSLLHCPFLKSHARLPEIQGADTEWELSNVYDPSCEARCVQNPAVVFKCSSFFGTITHLDTNRWNYCIDNFLPQSSEASAASAAEGALVFAVSRQES